MTPLTRRGQPASTEYSLGQIGAAHEGEDGSVRSRATPRVTKPLYGEAE